jgi:hypothetical protein
MRRTLALAFAGAIVLLAGGWLLFRGPHRPTDEGESPPKSVDGTEAPRPSSRRIAWTRGARQVYAIAADSKVRLDAPGRGPPARRQVLRGRLHLRVLDSGGAVAKVAFQLSDLRLTGDGWRPDAAMDLSQPHVAEFGADGSIRRVLFPPEVTPLGRLQLEESLRTFETVVPEGAGSTWTAEETHSMGRYAAAYSRDGAGGIEKRKTAYDAARPEDGAPGSIDIRWSLARIRIDPAASWIDRAEVEEELVPSVAGRKAFETALRATLERLPAETPSGLAIDGESGSLLARMRPADRSPDLPEPPPRPSSGPKKTPGEKEMAALRSGILEFDRIGGRDRSVLFGLRRLLREYPDLAWIAREMLDDQAVTPDTRSEIYHLLEQAGTPEAQEVLQDVIEDAGRSQSDRLQAVIALGGTAWPTDRSLEVLWGIADRADGGDIANTASLSLGRMGSSLRGTDPDRYTPLRGRMLDRLRSSGGSLQKANMLTSMGNTCDPSLSGEVAPYLAAESAQVRDAAAGALGSLSAEGVAVALTGRLLQEPHGGVRSSIVDSLRRLEVRDAGTAAVIDGLALREPDAGARFAMARYLAESLEAFPASRPNLEKMMATDSSEMVRNYLARQLLRQPAAGSSR